MYHLVIYIGQVRTQVSHAHYVSDFEPRFLLTSVFAANGLPPTAQLEIARASLRLILACQADRPLDRAPRIIGIAALPVIARLCQVPPPQFT